MACIIIIDLFGAIYYTSKDLCYNLKIDKLAEAILNLNSAFRSLKQRRPVCLESLP